MTPVLKTSRRLLHSYIQGETELSFRLIPSLTQSHTKPRTKTVKDEVILAK